MFRKGVRRLTLGALLVALVAALTAATGGSADVGFVTTQTVKSHDGATPPNQCPGLSPYVNERHYCLDVTTYNHLKKSGGAEVDLTLENWDQSALTNPTTQLTWNNAGVNLTFVSSNPAICSPTPAGGEVDCAWPNIPGLGSASGTADPCHPLPGPSCPKVKLFFTVDSTVGSVSFAATANAKESGNDSGGAANVETQTVDSSSTSGPPTMTFDGDSGTDANADATVLLPKFPFNKGHLHSDLGPASVDFSSGSSPAFIAQFAASSGVQCLLGVSCTGLDLNTDLSGAAGGTFSPGNQILWTADVAANNTNVVAVHTYDPVTITPSPLNKLTTAGTRFANCDGVVFTSFGTNPQPNLSTGQAYFVRNATTSGGNTSFQVSATAKGSLINVTGTGSFSGSCIRIIGDKPASEVTKACTTTSPPAQPTTPPVLCATKVDNSTVRVYLWDDANGHVGY
jgi:hypothetical protein